MTRTTRSMIAMGVLISILIVGGFVGIRLLTAPLPALPQDQAATCQPRTIRAGGTLTASDVTVDVYNASAISGLANRAMLALGKVGFQSGTLGNLPAKAKAKVGKRVTILTRDRTNDPVRLVAAQFKGKLRYSKQRVDTDKAVQVVVGAKYKGLDKSAMHKLKAKDPTEVCIPVAPTA